MNVFNEETLGEEIKKTWGEHGAHYEVYKELLKKANTNVIGLDSCDCEHPTNSMNGLNTCVRCGKKIHSLLDSQKDGFRYDGCGQ